VWQVYADAANAKGLEGEAMRPIDAGDAQAASLAIASMIDRSQQAKDKLVPGTPQHSLLENRIRALQTAMLLLEIAADSARQAAAPTSEDLHQAYAPLASLASKSAKAQTKLAEGSWQHTMLEENLKALGMALRLLQAHRGD
jgi:hypothetical protein